jgi:hypothetical protein
MNVIKFLVLTFFLSVSTCFAQDVNSLENTTWRGKDDDTDVQTTFLPNGNAYLEIYVLTKGKTTKSVLKFSDAKWKKSGNSILITHKSLEKLGELQGSTIKGNFTIGDKTKKFEYKLTDLSKVPSFESLFTTDNSKSENVISSNNISQVSSITNIENTTWRGKDGDSNSVADYQVTFAPNGLLKFQYYQPQANVVIKSEGGVATWKKEGSHIFIEYNSNFAERNGEIVGDLIIGTFKNKNGKEWKFQYKLIDINKTIPFEDLFPNRNKSLNQSSSAIGSTTQLYSSPSGQTNNSNNNTNDNEKLENEIKRLKLQNELDALKKQQQDLANAEVRKSQLSLQINSCIQDVNNSESLCKMGCLGAGFGSPNVLICQQNCDDRLSMRIDRCRSMR